MLSSILYALGDVQLTSYNGAVPLRSFVQLNDPVMGGLSTGTWAVNDEGKFGVFNGTVVDVPSLRAPGFIKAAADGKFADASSASSGALVLTVRSTTPAYKGFRVSFASGAAAAPYSCAGGGSIPFSRGCYKASFSVPAGDEFVEVRIPFHAFSDKWSPATGEQTTTCAQDSDVCPTAAKLKAIQRLEVWAEGADGLAHLELRSVAASPPATDSPELVAAASGGGGMRPPAAYDSCGAAVQPKLRYNISSRTQAPFLPVPVDLGESLAEAVCCDARAKPFAEPQFLFLSPDIALFDKLPAGGGATTFYDAVCGLPLFRAPVGRSLAAFQADTQEHGWPSFRPEEVVTANVVTNQSSGFVTSKCGTHLGSYLPDAQGPRWCIDLSCVAGNPAPEAAAVVEA